MHGKPPPNWECKCTFESITEQDGNYVEFQTWPSGTWTPSGYGKDTVLHLLETQFEKYTSDVEKASKDCAAAVRRLVNKGPPEWISDLTAFPLPVGDTHVSVLWFQDENKEVSARLKNAPSREAREALWNSQKEALVAMEQAEAASGKT